MGLHSTIRCSISSVTNQSYGRPSAKPVLFLTTGLLHAFFLLYIFISLLLNVSDLVSPVVLCFQG